MREFEHHALLDVAKKDCSVNIISTTDGQLTQSALAAKEGAMKAFSDSLH
jgi:hypothetical protein